MILSGNTREDLEEYLSTIEFRSSKENLRCLHSQSLVKLQNAVTQAEMVSQIESMETNITTYGQFHSLLKQLQMSRQMEYLNNARNEHVLNTAKWLKDDGRNFFVHEFANYIINTGWAVYCYPLLGKVKLGWVAVKAVITLLPKRLRQMNLYLQM